MTRNTKVLLLIAALVLLAAITSRAQIDPGIPDTVYVDSVVAYTITGGAQIPIHFVNDEALGAIEVTLTFESTELTFDSVSFSGSRVQDTDFKGASLVRDTVVAIFAFPQTSVPPGSGLLGAMYFSYPQSISTGTKVIDTMTLKINQIEYSTRFQTDTASPGTPPFTPQFSRGYLTIEEPPPTLDSIWVTHHEVEPDESFVADVYLYNERDIKDLQVALSWGSDHLVIDSVTFAGTRATTATQRLVSASNAQHSALIEMEFADVAPLEPGSGALAHLHFSVEQASPDTTIIIDTANVLGFPTLINYTIAQGGDQIVPIFNPGVVDIKIPTDVEDITDPDNLPTVFALNQNYPNPFNPSTEIEFSLPTASTVTLEVFNILGRKVRTLVDRPLPAGIHRVTFDARSGDGGMLASGVYFYKISADNFTESRKMLLVK